MTHLYYINIGEPVLESILVGSIPVNIGGFGQIVEKNTKILLQEKIS